MCDRSCNSQPPATQSCARDHGFPSLLSICLQSLIRAAGLKQIFAVYDLADELLLFVPERGSGTSALKERLISNIVNAYSVIRKEECADRLQEVLGPELYKQLEEREHERVRLTAQLKLARSGRVIETGLPAATADAEPSVSGTPYSFPLDCLVAGVRWPDEVDPSCREQYLSAASFQDAFGMPFDDFCRLPSWKKKDLRKKAQLF